MTLAVCCMSHTPQLDLTDPGPEMTADVESAFVTAREFVRRDGKPDRGCRHQCVNSVCWTPALFNRLLRIPYPKYVRTATAIQMVNTV